MKRQQIVHARHVPKLKITGDVVDRRWYALGLALLLAGILWHVPLLALSGILLLLVVCLIELWAQYCLRALYYTRVLSESRVSFGEHVRLNLVVENAKPLPLPWLEVEDMVPRILKIEETLEQRRGSYRDTTALTCLFNPRWYERVTRQYIVVANQRGVHTFGPATLRSGDLFGFLHREMQIPDRQYLLVYPLVAPIQRFGIPARYPFGEQRAPRRLLEDPSQSIGVRDYVYGDSIRRVHWKASARTMHLQSKVYQTTTTHTLLLFLNISTQLDRYYGVHPELRELSICATASITHWAIEQGYAVGLYANTILYLPDENGAQYPNATDAAVSPLPSTLAEQLKRRRIALPPASDAGQLVRILDVLARIQSYFGTNIEDVLLAERTRLPVGATVAVVTSAISELLIDTLLRIQQGGHAVAILFVGNAPPPLMLAHIKVYYLGGDETWRNLTADYDFSGEENKYTTKKQTGFSI